MPTGAYTRCVDAHNGLQCRMKVRHGGKWHKWWNSRTGAKMNWPCLSVQSAAPSRSTTDGSAGAPHEKPLTAIKANFKPVYHSRLPVRTQYTPKKKSDVLGCLARLLSDDEIAAAMWSAL